MSPFSAASTPVAVAVPRCQVLFFERDMMAGTAQTTK